MNERSGGRRTRGGKPHAKAGAKFRTRSAAREDSACAGGPPDASRDGEILADRRGREREWLRRIGVGETAAFDAAFAAYYDRLCMLACRYLKSPELAEEVVGDVFAHIWEQREALDVRENLNGYLHVAVRHRALKQLERIRVESRWCDEVSRGVRDGAMGQRPTSAEEELLSRELAEAFERAVANLPARSRHPYTLHRRNQMSYAEIGKLMHISVRTVENNVARAVRLLRAQLAVWLT